MSKRMNYFDGLFLDAEDFKVEQDYHLEMRRRHTSSLHAWGIASGLQLSFVAGESRVTVAAGLAYDRRGRELIWPDAKTFDLEDQAGSQDKELFCTIHYFEEETDPTSATGVTGNTRITEEARIRFGDDPPNDPGLRLVLDRVTLDANGVVTKVGNSPPPNQRRSALGVPRSFHIGGGRGAANGSYALNLGSGPSDLARVRSFVSDGGSSTSLNIEVGDDRSDGINIRTTGWNPGQKGDIKIEGGNVVIGVEDSGTRSLEVRSGNRSLVVARNDGNVGIGTSDPGSYRLAIKQGKTNSKQGLRILNAEGTRSAQLWVGSGGAVLDAESTASLHLRTQGKDRLFITNGGNVGLGMSAPKVRLQVAGSVRGSQDGGALRIKTEHGYVDLGPRNKDWSHFVTDREKFYFNKPLHVATGKIGSYNDRDLSLHTGGTPRITVLRSNGYVGIGTGSANPADRLHVADGNLRVDKNASISGAIQAGSIKIDGTASIKGALVVNGILNLFGEEANPGNFWTITEDAEEHFRVFRRDRPGGLRGPYFTISRSGNIGIGRDANDPAAKLQVSGGAIMPSEGNNENSGILFPKNAFGGSGDSAWIRYHARSDEEATLEIGISNDADDHIALMPSGSVGIGTTEPRAKLHVKGTCILGQDPPKTPTLATGWSTFSNAYNDVEYFKDSMGYVHLRGRVRSTQGAGKFIFKLPNGYAPSRRETFNVPTAGSVAGMIELRPVAVDQIGNVTGGEVERIQGGQWISLDGITFRGVTKAWSPPDTSL